MDPAEDWVPVSDLEGYLDTTGTPKYSFALFQDAEKKLEGINNAPLGLLAQYVDINNTEFTDPEPVNGRKKIAIRSLHGVAFGSHIRPGDPRIRGSLIDYINDDKDHPLPPCCTNVNSRIPSFQTTTEQWRATPFMKALIQHLEKHAPSMEKVHTILGFGLGHLAYEDPDPDTIDPHTEHPRRIWLQHLTCQIIKNALERAQGTPGTIKIYTQDPDYCPNCIALLGGQGITAVNSATKYLTDEKLLNKHTFVVTKAPGVPIRQIVFDLTADCGGPAGILCDKMLGEDDGDDEKEEAKSPREETGFQDPPSDRWCAFVKRNGVRCLAFDDSEVVGEGDEEERVWGGVKVKGGAAMYKGKECLWSVFEDARVYLNGRRG